MPKAHEFSVISGQAHSLEIPSALIDEARELMPPENFAELLKRGDKSDFRNAIATWRRIHREERINY